MILIVEDEFLISRAVTEHLEQRGCEVMPALHPERHRSLGGVKRLPAAFII